MPKLGDDMDCAGFKVKNVPLPSAANNAANKAYVDARVDYTHEQNTPSALWVVNHNLGYKPNVRITNTAGDSMMTNVTDIDANTLHVIFDNANAGEAYCS